jgi:hypothetical protein
MVWRQTTAQWSRLHTKESDNARYGSNMARLRRVQRPAHRLLRSTDHSHRLGPQRRIGNLLSDMAALDRRACDDGDVRGDQSQRRLARIRELHLCSVLHRCDRFDRTQAAGSSTDEDDVVARRRGHQPLGAAPACWAPGNCRRTSRGSGATYLPRRPPRTVGRAVAGRNVPLSPAVNEQKGDTRQPNKQG